MNGSFNSKIPSTISVDFHSIHDKDANGSLLNITLFDTGCYEIWNSIVNVFVKNADLVVFAYDCTNRSTFEHVPDTIKRLSMHMVKDIKGRSILISTKCEVDKERKKVTEEEARLLQSEYGFLDYF
jgi:Ras-related protein Rab-39B